MKEKFFKSEDVNCTRWCVMPLLTIFEEIDILHSPFLFVFFKWDQSYLDSFVSSNLTTMSSYHKEAFYLFLLKVPNADKMCFDLK